MKKIFKLTSLIVIAALIISVIALPISASWNWVTATGASTTNRGNSYTVKRASTPIVVDGKISAGEEWNYAANSQIFEVSYVAGDVGNNGLDRKSVV